MLSPGKARMMKPVLSLEPLNPDFSAGIFSLTGHHWETPQTFQEKPVSLKATLQSHQESLFFHGAVWKTFSMVTESPSGCLSFRSKDEMSQDTETVSEESGWELEPWASVVSLLVKPWEAQQQCSMGREPRAGSQSPGRIWDLYYHMWLWMALNSFLTQLPSNWKEVSWVRGSERGSTWVGPLSAH